MQFQALLNRLKVFSLQICCLICINLRLMASFVGVKQIMLSLEEGFATLTLDRYKYMDGGQDKKTAEDSKL